MITVMRNHPPQPQPPNHITPITFFGWSTVGRWACGGVMVFPVAVAGKQAGAAGMGIFLVVRSSRCVAAGKGLRTSH
ncbi:hypothetical protein ACFY2M_35335 [Streptomyces sp. NPDC001276]|uniref:hypothetical protein n=1 Tax=Streptomyces sp. NPDC001276 TaxID=3364555 RepID=UPI0036B93201